MRRILRLAALLTALWGVGKLVSGRLNQGDVDDDEFLIATVFGGLEPTSHATSLRHGRVLACCAGVQLDLREATLDPAGATLTVRAIMGGVEVYVPAGWRVTVDADTLAGGVEVDVTPPETLAEDAPTLHVEAIAQMGGIVVSTDDAPEPAADDVAA